jgi:hypothetical protein
MSNTFPKPVPFTFDQTAKSLKKHGIELSADGSLFSIQIQEKDYIEIEGDIELKKYIKEKIIIFDRESVWCYNNDYYVPGYLYLSEYRSLSYGNPRAHLWHCKTLEEIGTQRYRFTFQKKVTFYCKEQREWLDEQELPICKNCKTDLRTRQQDIGPYLEEMNRCLFDYYNGEHMNLDGYPIRWGYMSKIYRESRKFTCESCGFQAKDPSDRRFLQVHHINGDKRDNELKNLKCLCIECHAQVDEHHTKLKSNKLYREFYAKHKRSGFKISINHSSRLK